jgi:hypothetical protein
MSTIQVTREWKSASAENPTTDFLAKKGKKLQSVTKCIICSSPKSSYIFGKNKEPLVLRCTKCGHKSWARA